MCVACTEFIRDRLNMKEYFAAMQETTIEDKAHLYEIEDLVRKSKGQSTKLKEHLRTMLDHPKK